MEKVLFGKFVGEHVVSLESTSIGAAPLEVLNGA